MTVDEWSLRQAARDLAHLYRTLDEMKLAPTRQPEVRTMRPAPGPRGPASDQLISLDVELTSKLFEMVRDLANHIRPSIILHKDGARLAAFVAWHAQAASEVTFAEELMEEIQDQVKQLKRRLQPDGADTVAKRLEPYHRVEVILQRLSRAGYRHTRDSLRMLAARSGGAITTELHKGRSTYRYSEVLHHLESKETNNA